MSNDLIHQRILALEGEGADEACAALLEARYAAIKHPGMKALITSGRGIDVSIFPKTESGDYILPIFFEGMDYVDCFWQAWINSIGMARKSVGIAMPNGTIRILPAGSILASWTHRFMDDTRFDCLFRR